MKSRLKLWVSALIMAVLPALAFMPLASADGANLSQAIQIGISPVSQKLKLSAGQTYNSSVTVVNNGNTDFNFDVYAAPYQVSDESYNPTFSKETTRTQISRWVTFDGPTSYHLGAHGTQVINFTINVPQNIPAGGQYGVIFAETTGENTSAGGIIAKKRVGMLLYAGTDGHTVDGGNYLGFSSSSFFAQSTFKATTRVQNIGNTDFVVDTTATANGIFGQKYSKFTHESEVLPDTTRAIQTVLPDLPKFGVVKVKVTTSFLGQTHTATRWVLCIPPLWLGVIVAAIVLFVLIDWLFIHSLKRRLQAAQARVKSLATGGSSNKSKTNKSTGKSSKSKKK